FDVPDFTYEALAKTGTKATGTLTANSEREAALILDSRGLFPVKIGLAKTQAAAAGGGFRLFKKVKGRQLATMYSQLADLLHSGVPLLRSLELLERQSTNPTLQAVIRDVRARVADGTGLAQSMAFHPHV